MLRPLKRPLVPESFWAKAATDANLTAQHVDAARFAFEAHGLVRGQLPILQALQQRQQSEKWSSGRDLARLTRDDWRALVRAEQVGVLGILRGRI